MRVTVKATPAGTVEELSTRDDMYLLTDSQDVRDVKGYFDNIKRLERFDGFFVKIVDGDYAEVYGFEGTVPYLNRPIWKITMVMSPGPGVGRIAKDRKKAHKSTKPSGFGGLR